MMLGIKMFIVKIKIDALKAVVLSAPIFPKKNTAALSLIPRSPKDIGSIDFTNSAEATAWNVPIIGTDSNAEINKKYCVKKMR